MEAGALLLHRSTDPGVWPRGARAVLIAVAGLVLGFFLGNWLAGMLLGTGTVPAPPEAVSALMSALHQFPHGTAPPGSMVISAFMTMNMGAIAGYLLYFSYSRREQVILSAQISAAERDATQAQLKLLAAQLEPHMLFNTLANLRALIIGDPPRAIAMLDQLDSYLRVTLTGSLAFTHSLAAEFGRLADYLALMQVRMGPRLRYTLDLPDDLRNLPVPPLLLQPLVENSIRHGLEPKVEGGQITVRAWLDGQRLLIEVRDTGVGLDAAAVADDNTGFGLTQVRNRLVNVYGPAATLELACAPGGGACVILVLPLECP
jgi:LytS/YehU family sensor histidine kinase